MIPGGLKMLLLGALVAVAASVAGYVWWLQGKNAELHTQVGAQQAALTIQTDTIQAMLEINQEWAQSYEKFSNKLIEMTEVQKEATAQTRKLNDVLSRHNLHALALAKPGLIENRINAGSVDALCMFEFATGGHPDKACGRSKAGEAGPAPSPTN
jgi:hypothetical protein